ncbi:hypothetical protein NDU88_000940 [Pleurodeles waltl]|uniref:Integrase zinc-binding domain-containing protein n=1 Tax=Pleurodeles waltl TaxID=8319 RepID=A0AAV7P2C1_PLEWA|nr:hypothetical protein NDU88_000940 [Pleurodeles waltl]
MVEFHQSHRTLEAQRVLNALYHVRHELPNPGPSPCYPSNLTNQVIQLAHAGQQGVDETQNLIESKVWLPQLDELVEITVHVCIWCQAAGNADPPLPEITEKGLQLQ